MVLNAVIKASKKSDKLCNQEQYFVFKLNSVRKEMCHVFYSKSREQRHRGRGPTALFSLFLPDPGFLFILPFFSFILFRFSVLALALRVMPIGC